MLKTKQGGVWVLVSPQETCIVSYCPTEVAAILSEDGLAPPTGAGPALAPLDMCYPPLQIPTKEQGDSAPHLLGQVDTLQGGRLSI